VDDHAAVPSPRGRGIALIGYRATGKTTVGRILAKQMGRSFHDCDAEIEHQSGRSIRTFFTDEGEAAFRDLEEQALRDLCQKMPETVLATGGGAILRETNRQVLARFGTVIWLTAPPEILVERLRQDPNSRPSLTAAGLLDEVAILLEAREPLYRNAADLIVDASLSDPKWIADEVLRLIRSQGEKKASP
jgi:shikimate kinase